MKNRNGCNFYISSLLSHSYICLRCYILDNFETEMCADEALPICVNYSYILSILTFTIFPALILQEKLVGNRENGNTFHIPIGYFGTSLLNMTLMSSIVCFSLFHLTNDFLLKNLNTSVLSSLLLQVWWNALEKGSVPLVMGTTKENYKKILPPNSFIHVDDFDSVEQLAKYLKWAYLEMGVIKSDLQQNNDYISKK